VFSEAMVENGRKVVEELKQREGEAIDIVGLLSVVCPISRFFIIIIIFCFFLGAG